MIYLSFPYTSDDENIQRERFEKSCIITARLMENGVSVYNPLAISLSAIEIGNCKLNHSEWLNIDIQAMKVCSMMVLLELDGWKESVGVNEELKKAREMNLTVLRVPYNDNTVHRIMNWIK